MTHLVGDAVERLPLPARSSISIARRIRLLSVAHTKADGETRLSWIERGLGVLGS